MIIGDRPNSRCKKGKWLTYCGRTASSCGDWCPDFINPIPETMSETFRSKVEEIENEENPLCQNCIKSPTECIKCKTDRICAALKERVEGMPIMPNDGDGYCTACKEHLLKEGE